MSIIEGIISSSTANAESLSREGAALLQSAVTSARSSLTLGAVDFPELEGIPDYEGNIIIPDLPARSAIPDAEIENPEYIDVKLDDAEDTIEPPDINLDGLFSQTQPSIDITPFSIEAPNSVVAGISSALTTAGNITVGNINAPDIGRSRDAINPPNVNLREFETDLEFDSQTEEPPEIKEQVLAQFGNSLVSMRDYVKSQVDEWTLYYAPNLKEDLSLLKQKINNKLEGGDVLSDEFICNQITKARSIADEGASSQKEEIANAQKRRGFSLPQGIIEAASFNADQQAQNNISKQAIEISIEKERIELQHLQFVMSIAEQNNQFMINSAFQMAQIASATNGQALSLAQEVGRALQSEYNFLLERTREKLNILNAQAAIHESDIRTGLAKYEETRLLIQIEQQKDSADSNLISIYQAELTAQQIKIKTADLKVGAIEKAGNLARLDVDLFRSKVDAYVAKNKAVESQLNVYNASINGDQKKADGEIAKLEIYTKQVDAAIAKRNTALKEVDILNEINRNTTDQFDSRVRAQQLKINSKLELYKLDSSNYSDQLRAVSLELEKEGTVYKSNMQKAIAISSVAGNIANHDQSRVELNARLFSQKTELIAKTNIAVGRSFADMASSAMNSNHTMVSTNKNE